MQIGSQVLKVKRKRREILQTLYLRPSRGGKFSYTIFKYESVNLVQANEFFSLA